ncbi:MAG: vacuolar iron transporter family protein [Actinomycetota bacterium]|nr:vacuolar iron transporter family protein [Actinomycetota bacterium]
MNTAVKPTTTVPPHWGGTAWLRAAVLGADDGIVSTASLMLGVAASSASHGAVLTAGFAGLAAGAMAMATGEYVSVHSQRDAERADLRLEQSQLAADPEGELDELTDIYRARGLDDELARRVAEQLSRDDRLAAHARDELGQHPGTLARPLQAAWVSALAFALGAAVPIVAVVLAPGRLRSVFTIVSALGALGLLGSLGARAGGAPRRTAAARVMLGGGLAMAVTTLVGRLAGAAGV